MAKMIEVTEAGGAHLGAADNVKISVNADVIKILRDVDADSVGSTEIVFSDGTSINVTETQDQLRKLINK